MNKNAVKIVIIIVAFAASGLVLYYGMFQGGGAISTPGELAGLGGLSSSAQAGEEILPNGEKLEFGQVIDKKRFEYNLVTYPLLNPSTEVGIEENNLITPFVQE